MEIQQEIRRRALELREAVSDVESWISDMNIKDKELAKKHDKVPLVDRELPPIRGEGESIESKTLTTSASSSGTTRSSESSQKVNSSKSSVQKVENDGKSAVKTEKKTKQVKKEKAPYRGTDWAKWDKIEAKIKAGELSDDDDDDDDDDDLSKNNNKKTVDSENKKSSSIEQTAEKGKKRDQVQGVVKVVEEEEEEPVVELNTPGANALPEAAPVKSVPQPVVSEERKAKAAASAGKILREQGNVCFKRGDYEGAEKAYSDGLGMVPGDVMLLSNRAQVRLKLNKFAAAEADATEALAGDDTHVKSWYRRAMARKSLKKTAGAIEDLMHILTLDPDHKEAERQLGILRGAGSAAVKSEQTKKKSAGAKTPTVVEKKEPAPVKAADEKKAAKPPGRRMLIREVNSASTASDATGPADDSKSLVSEKESKKEKGEDQEEHPTGTPTPPVTKTLAATPAATPAAAGVVVEAPVTVTTPKSSGKSSTASSDSPVIIDKSEVEGQMASDVVSAAVNKSMMAMLEEPVPKNGYEFERKWASLKARPDLVTEFFAKVPADAIGRMFKASFSGELLMGFVQSVSDVHLKNGDLEKGVAVLDAVTKVDRFDVAALCLSGAESSRVKQTLDSMESALGDLKEATGWSGVRSRFEDEMM